MSLVKRPPAPSRDLVIETSGESEIVITRSFQAPIALVWRCHTDPNLVSRWLLGPGGWSMPDCQIDLKVGGRYRYEWQHEDGRRMGLSGVFREVQAPGRLVQTELFDEDWTGGETLVAHVFRETGDGTLLTMTIAYSSRAARDRALASGMARGMEAGYVRLDGLLSDAPRAS